MRTQRIQLVVVFLGFSFISNAQIFPCDGTNYIGLNGDLPGVSTIIYRVVIDNAMVEFEPLTEVDLRLNAFGYNPIDNFIYGVDLLTNSNVYQIRADGSATVVYTEPTLSEWLTGAGDVRLADTTYIVHDRNTDNIYLYKLTEPVVKVGQIELTWNPSSGNSGTADLALHDLAVDPADPNIAFSFQANYPNDGPMATRGHLLRINIDPEDPNFGHVHSVGMLTPTHAVMFGALFFDRKGDLYGYGSQVPPPVQQNTLVRIDKSDASAELIAMGPTATGNDGCSCPYHVDLLKHAEVQEYFCDSAIVMFTLTVVNNSPELLSGVILQDTLPAGFTILDVSPPDGGISGSLSIDNDVPAFELVDGVLQPDAAVSFQVFASTDQAGIYSNQASLSGLPMRYGSILSSDDSMTIDTDDPTEFEIADTLIQENVGMMQLELCTGDTTELNGVKYTQAGDYETVISSQFACDSILLIHIEEINPNEGQLQAGLCPGDSATINGEVFDTPGIYQQVLIDASANGCDSLVIVEVLSLPEAHDTISATIVLGDTITINSIRYDSPGEFEQVLSGLASNGCDSVLTINISVIQKVIEYDLDDCWSHFSDSTNFDYTEFTTGYPNDIPCGAVEATVVYRENPNVNAHSCTPGVSDSPAMCVSALNNCAFDPGNEKSLVFEVTVTPSPDSAVLLEKFTFYEKAPVTFDWIGGDSGINNPPALYGVRILKDGVEIYVQNDIETTETWSEESFSFEGLDGFTADTVTTYRFELLGYCVQDNGGLVAAWDIDQIGVYMGCSTSSDLQGVISGSVLTERQDPVPNVEIHLLHEEGSTPSFMTISDTTGEYAFHTSLGHGYMIRGFKNTGFLDGVNTLDLILIQRHLLGIQKFDSPRQWLAADANGSNTVSALDLLALRRLLLGIDSELKSQTSWRFGDAYQSISNEDPWQFKEEVALPVLKGDVRHADLLAIKTGDVDGSLMSSALNHSARLPHVSALQLVFEDRTVKAGEEVSVGIRSTESVDLFGLQMAIAINNARLKGVGGAGLRMEGAFGLSETSSSLRIAWIDPDGIRVEKGDVLFTLKLIANQDGVLRDILEIGAGLAAEAYSGYELNVNGVDLHAVAPGATIPKLDVYPNPCTSEAWIEFHLAEDGFAEIDILDVSGKVRFVISGHYKSGSHREYFPVSRFGIQDAVLVCRLQTGQTVVSRKLVVCD